MTRMMSRKSAESAERGFQGSRHERNWDMPATRSLGKPKKAINRITAGGRMLATQLKAPIPNSRPPTMVVVENAAPDVSEVTEEDEEPPLLLLLLLRLLAPTMLESPPLPLTTQSSARSTAT